MLLVGDTHGDKSSAARRAARRRCGGLRPLKVRAFGMPRVGMLFECDYIPAHTA